MSHAWPWSYLGRCQQTSPMLGSQAEVPEAGREEHTYTHIHRGVWVSWWGDANSDTYITHKSHRETEKECRSGKSGW